MEIKAKAKNIRMSAKKVRLVLDVVRNMPVDKALDQLKFVNKKAALPVSLLIKTAIADAGHNYNLEASNLMIKELKADEGATMKRWMPKAFGRAGQIRKRTCHISVILKEIVDSGKKEARVVKADDPVKLDDIAKDVKKSETKKDAKLEKKADIDKDSTGKGFASKVFRRKSG